MDLKTCRRCGTEKPLSEFHKDSGNKDGRCSYCKECNKAKTRAWSAANKGRVQEHTRKRAEQGKFRDYNLRKKYGLTREAYAALLAAQGGRCAICGSEDPGRGNKDFSVDHCHTSNQVRGLLCNTCNRGIGLLQDDPNVLERAAQYLRQAPYQP